MATGAGRRRARPASRPRPQGRGRALPRTIEACAEQGVGWLTLFAFSSENWLRPAEEVRALTGLLRLYLRSEVATLAREGIRLRVIGDRARFGAETMREIERAEAVTAGGTRLNLNVALSYGARDEIVAAARAIAQAAGPARSTRRRWTRLPSPAGCSPPACPTRTSSSAPRASSGCRTSCSGRRPMPFVFQEVLWPDYGAEHLARAQRDYGRREGRYGART